MIDASITAVDEANEQAWGSCILNPQSSLAMAQEALKRATELEYSKGVADAILNIGWATHYQSKLAEAYAAFLEAHRLYEKLHDIPGICKSLNAFGIYHASIFRLDKAVEYYTRSLELARENGLLDRELIAMANIGELCLDLGNPQGALEYLVSAYDKMPDDFGPENKADCLRNIGQAFLAMDNLPLAAEFTEKSYEIISASGELIAATDSIETLANVALAEGNLDKAHALVATGLEMVGKTGNLSQKASLLIVRGNLLIERGESGEALDVLGHAERLCLGINLKSRLFKVHELIAKAYESEGDFERALSYYKKFATFRAEVQSEDTANKLRSLKAQAEIERAQQEAEIYRLRNIDLKEKTEALEDINKQITSISTIGQRITASLDFNTVVQTLNDCLKPFLEMDMFGIALFEHSRN
ncbi:MAG: tetratricopeptide repeat protein, partial [Spirochaetales bacterium]|nr:tetratricopeptide repeat protein [Spirochaetales bacterium]